jgi:hypothetical protein
VGGERHPKFPITEEIQSEIHVIDLPNAVRSHWCVSKAIFQGSQGQV